MIYGNIGELIGETISEIRGLVVGSEEVYFECVSGRTFRMWYEQDCCASCSIEDVAGDVQDLIGSPIVMSELASNEPTPEPPQGFRDDSETWTFVKFATAKGYVTVRWHGSSNGYYSEEPSFGEVGG